VNPFGGAELNDPLEPLLDAYRRYLVAERGLAPMPASQALAKASSMPVLPPGWPCMARKAETVLVFCTPSAAVGDATWPGGAAEVESSPSPGRGKVALTSEFLWRAGTAAQRMLCRRCRGSIDRRTDLALH